MAVTSTNGRNTFASGNFLTTAPPLIRRGEKREIMNTMTNKEFARQLAEKMYPLVKYDEEIYPGYVVDAWNEPIEHRREAAEAVILKLWPLIQGSYKQGTYRGVVYKDKEDLEPSL